MSRIGKKPVKVPAGVKVALNGRRIHVEGTKGSLDFEHHPSVNVAWDESEKSITVSIDESSMGDRHVRALWGTNRSIINNMVIGVTQGYSKQLNVVGVGYKVDMKGKTLVMQLGFSHPVEYPSPDGIVFEVDSKKNTIKVNGINKETVGQTSAEIRKLRPPEPYKGKGVMYSTEKIRRKAGKTVVGAK